MAKGNATPLDAHVIIQLYDLRREAVMRNARRFMVSEFWPKNYEEFKGVLTDYGTEHNEWMRQVLTYWDMAAAMVLRGAVDEDLFFETNNEPYFLFAKFGAFIPAAREDFVNPDFLGNLEKLAARPRATQRIKGLRERLGRRTQTAAAKSVR